MKKSVAQLLLVVLICTSAYPDEKTPFNFVTSGNWGSYSIEEQGSRAVTVTNLDGIVISIDFTPSVCARAYLTIHAGGAQISDVGKTDVIHSNVKLRVDTKDIWNVDDVVREIQESVSGESAVAGFVIPVNNEFLNQLRYGDTLRIKIEGVPAFHASLSGSRSAINRAIALCQEIAGAIEDDDQYFERQPAQGADDESYF